MNRTAYGYFSSQQINKSEGIISFHNIGRDSRLFYPKSYIDNDLMKECLFNNKNNSDPQKKCFEKYKVSEVISYPNYLKNKADYNCKLKKSFIATRNPFNSRKSQIEICYLKSSFSKK